MRHSIRSLLAASTVLLTIACGDGTPFSASVDTVSGAYHATVLTATQGSTTMDFLQNGGSLNVTLNPDGTTTGRLFVPDMSGAGADLDVDLAGSWVLTGTTVNFIQEADTFIRDVPFTATRNQLSAQHVFNEGTTNEFTVRATLVK